MKTAFYFSTRSNDPTNTPAYQSLTRFLYNDTLFYTANNTEGLSKKYNEMFSKLKNKFENIVFLHDDVYVDDYYVCEKLEKAHKEFDIVGLAGGINPKIQQLALWHLMCGGFGSNNLRGAVAHPTNSGSQITVTNFGPTPSRVTILDGLFLSVNTRKASSVNWKFNENYTFHHYDIASSIDANNKKLKLGVAPIWVIHKSPGLLNINDKVFLDSQERFLNEYR
jgi:hypothetical protein